MFFMYMYVCSSVYVFFVVLFFVGVFYFCIFQCTLSSSDLPFFSFAWCTCMFIIVINLRLLCQKTITIPSNVQCTSI